MTVVVTLRRPIQVVGEKVRAQTKRFPDGKATLVDARNHLHVLDDGFAAEELTSSAEFGVFAEMTAWTTQHTIASFRDGEWDFVEVKR